MLTRFYFVLLAILLTATLNEPAQALTEDFFSDHAAVMLLIDPADGQIVKANKAAADFYGYPLSKLERSKIQDINQLTAEQVAEERQLAKEQSRSYFIFPHKMADGTVKTVEVHSRPVSIDGRLLLYSTIHPLVENQQEQTSLTQYQDKLEDSLAQQAQALESRTKAIIFLLSSGIILTFFLLSYAIKKNRDLKSANTLVRSERQKLEEIIWGTNVGTWEWNIVTGKTVFNDIWAELLGYSLSELAPTTIETWTQFVHPDDLPDSQAKLDACFTRTHDHYNCECRMRHKDGRWIWVLDRGKVVEWTEDGKALRMAGTHTDITYHKEMAQQLTQAKKEADAANLAKSEFLANMSHELRTPMMGIRGVLDLLRNDESVTKSASDLLDSLDVSSKSLMALLDDILDLSKIEAGKLSLHPTPCEPAIIVKSLVNIFATSSSQKGILISTNADTYDTYCCALDELRFRQILANLLNNAVKFTSEGEIHVDMALTSHTDHDTLCIRVTDTGIGMSETEQAKIFERFKQAEGGTTRKYGGTGLGLAISNELTALFKGTLEVESTPGVGTTFTLQLPVLPADKSDKTAKSLSLPPMSILLAEDNTINQKVVSRMLMQYGHEVSIAPDGLQAVEQAQARPFDLILMDMHMPEMDGVEATRTIRQNDGPNRGTPIIAFTADAIALHHDSFREAGVNGIITKPVIFEKLTHEISKIIH
ncbi:ATP-binding protein [Terasakiella pusilla]|uniref:ATP-binding protein n=1 Tax=Terasakiella pusilla TaxID=64973 RepID=UPI003AA7B6A4